MFERITKERYLKLCNRLTKDDEFVIVTQNEDNIPDNLLIEDYVKKEKLSHIQPKVGRIIKVDSYGLSHDCIFLRKCDT